MKSGLPGKPNCTWVLHHMNVSGMCELVCLLLQTTLVEPTSGNTALTGCQLCCSDHACHPNLELKAALFSILISVVWASSCLDIPGQCLDGAIESLAIVMRSAALPGKVSQLALLRT